MKFRPGLLLKSEPGRNDIVLGSDSASFPSPKPSVSSYLHINPPPLKTHQAWRRRPIKIPIINLGSGAPGHLQPPPRSSSRPFSPRASRTSSALALLCIFYLLLSNHCQAASLLQASPVLPPRATPATSTSRRRLLFPLLPSRRPYLHLWYSPNSTRALAFLDRLPDGDPASDLPPTLVSEDTSRFPYTFPGDLRSAIRVARVIKEAVDRGELRVRWYVFGDDDAVFFVDNLVSVLSKYDHSKWCYIGSNSKSYKQNVKYSFDMAFGGRGFAISRSLAVVLARVLDSCLVRYSHLYGSNARIFSCLAELGVGLTHEPGFHQVPEFVVVDAMFYLS